MSLAWFAHLSGTEGSFCNAGLASTIAKNGGRDTAPHFPAGSGTAELWTTITCAGALEPEGHTRPRHTLYTEDLSSCCDSSKYWLNLSQLPRLGSTRAESCSMRRPAALVLIVLGLCLVTGVEGESRGSSTPTPSSLSSRRALRAYTSNAYVTEQVCGQIFLVSWLECPLLGEEGECPAITNSSTSETERASLRAERRELPARPIRAGREHSWRERRAGGQRRRRDARAAVSLPHRRRRQPGHEAHRPRRERRLQ